MGFKTFFAHGICICFFLIFLFALYVGLGEKQIMDKDKQRLSPIVIDAEGKDTIVIYAHDTPCKNCYFKQHPELRGIVPVCTGKDDQNTIQKALNEITEEV